VDDRARPLESGGSKAPVRERPATLRLTVERTFRARIEAVWALWTTRAGIESWWSPEHLRTTVKTLDVRPGGEIDIDIRYAAIETSPEFVQVFETAGVPVNIVIRGRFSEVVPPRLISFQQFHDLGRQSEPYEIFTRVELRPIEESVHLLLTAYAVPTPHWTTLGSPGLEGQIDRLVRAVGP
jgi:uncharacterized protein YndB with AHSA1/START domain